MTAEVESTGSLVASIVAEMEGSCRDVMGLGLRLRLELGLDGTGPGYGSAYGRIVPFCNDASLRKQHHSIRSGNLWIKIKKVATTAALTHNSNSFWSEPRLLIRVIYSYRATYYKQYKGCYPLDRRNTLSVPIGPPTLIYYSSPCRDSVLEYREVTRHCATLCNSCKLFELAFLTLPLQKSGLQSDLADLKAGFTLYYPLMTTGLQMLGAACVPNCPLMPEVSELKSIARR